jgi:hypothetical protein
VSKAGSRTLRGRRIAQAIVASGVGLGVVGLVGTGVAFADNGAAAGLSISVADAQSVLVNLQSECAVSLTSNLTVVNISNIEDPPGAQLVYSAVQPTVSWTTATSSGVIPYSAITVVSDGTPALEAGDTLGIGQTQTYSGYQTDFTIPAPCSAITSGDLAIHVVDQYGNGSGDEPFVANGVFSPIDAAGGLGLAALLGGGLAMTYRRWRRPSGTGRHAVAGGKA